MEDASDQILTTKEDLKTSLKWDETKLKTIQTAANDITEDDEVHSNKFQYLYNYKIKYEVFIRRVSITL